MTCAAAALYCSSFETAVIGEAGLSQVVAESNNEARSARSGLEVGQPTAVWKRAT